MDKCGSCVSPALQLADKPSLTVIVIPPRVPRTSTANRPQIGPPIHHSSPDENNVSLCDVLLHLSAEEQVAADGGLHDLIEARLIDGKGVGVPSVDTGLVDVQHHHLDVGALLGNHGHGWTTHISGADTSDFRHLGISKLSGNGKLEKSCKVVIVCVVAEVNYISQRSRR